MANQETVPVVDGVIRPANTLTLTPSIIDPRTGQLYAHRDMVPMVPDWSVEDHIGPISADERFGDIESWCEYVAYYGSYKSSEFPALLTWNSTGLAAVLDYHGANETPGRCAWKARHDFVPSVQWRHWSMLANGVPRHQKDVLERLEDVAADIVDPDPSGLLALLRTLRATASCTATTDLNPDGSSSISYQRTTTVKNAGPLELSMPPEIKILIPVLKGHVEPSGDTLGIPVRYEIPVKIRVSVDDQARLALRLSIPTAERILEDVYADRVQAAKTALGEGYMLYRAADR